MNIQDECHIGSCTSRWKILHSDTFNSGARDTRHSRTWETHQETENFELPPRIEIDVWTVSNHDRFEFWMHSIEPVGDGGGHDGVGTLRKNKPKDAFCYIKVSLGFSQ